MLSIRQEKPPPGLLGQSTLFLDFDGTLVDIAATPSTIDVSADLPDLLERLSDMLQGRLALVTGRAVADVAVHLPGYRGIIAGSHGGEMRLADGAIQAPQRPEA
ncbi:trehalose-phosphatase, partial [Blastomonas sp.]|uniref:trehalose-phosphatase n=1 Tax=Blastomonas sp. TaxID=1909299 RepID=UPI003593FB40